MIFALFLKKAKACLRINWKRKIKVHLCYLIVSCRLLLLMTRMGRDWNLKGLGQIFQVFNAVPAKLTKNGFCSLMKIKLFEIFFITIQQHFVIKVQSTNKTIVERCSFFEVQNVHDIYVFFMFYQRGDVTPKKDPVSTLQYLLGPLPKLAVQFIG